MVMTLSRVKMSPPPSVAAQREMISGSTASAMAS